MRISGRMHCTCRGALRSSGVDDRVLARPRCVLRARSVLQSAHTHTHTHTHTRAHTRAHTHTNTCLVAQ